MLFIKQYTIILFIHLSYIAQKNLFTIVFHSAKALRASLDCFYKRKYLILYDNQISKIF